MTDAVQRLFCRLAQGSTTPRVHLDLCDRILAERRGALEPEAIAKLPGKVAFADPGDRRDDSHRQQRAEQGQRLAVFANTRRFVLALIIRLEPEGFPKYQGITPTTRFAFTGQ